MKKSIAILSILILSACAQQKDMIAAKNGTNCTVSAVPGGAQVSCSDGTSALLSNGAVGSTGTSGSNGLTGSIGATGSRGPQGIQGVVGEIGPKGDIGLRGEKGLTGSTGATGLTGSKGDTGIQGPKGDKGERGEKGESGYCLLDNEYDDNGDDKMFICHRRSNGTYKTLRVGPKAYNKHRLHYGDTIGICFAGDDHDCD